MVEADVELTNPQYLLNSNPGRCSPGRVQLDLVAVNGGATVRQDMWLPCSVWGLSSPSQGLSPRPLHHRAGS